MHIPELQRCCCGCCSVQTGTVIIAILSAVSSLVTCASYVADLSAPLFVPEDLEQKELIAAYHTIVLMMLLIAIFYFVISVLLLVAVKKRIALFFNIWLFVGSYNLASSVIPAFVITIFFFYMSEILLAFVFMVFYGIAVSTSMYFLVVVHSCKLWVMNEEIGTQEV